jgi:Tfp pilus assembly protein PilF
MGNLALDRGDQRRATEWYERTLALDPQYAGALKNLGYLALEARNFPSAVSYLERAAQAEADNATTWYLLAKAKIGLGDRPSARAVLKEALRMKPTQPEFLALAAELDQP